MISNYEIVMVLKNGSVQRMVIFRQNAETFDPLSYAEEYATKHRFDVKYTSVNVFGETH